MMSFIDKKTIENVLMEHYNCKNIKIIDMTSKMAVAKGENYASSTWRVKVHWESENQQREEALIVKTPPEGQYLNNLVMSNKFFETEAAYYEELVPIYNSIYKKSTGNDLIKFGPTIYKCKKHDLVILEDISPAGFQMGDKRNGIDFDHGVLGMKSIARNHGLSIAALRKDPTLKDHPLFQAPFYSMENSKMMYPVWVGTAKNIINEMTTWPEFKKFINQIRIVNTDEWVHYFKSAGKLRVLCQGDCWVNNMLFRYDKNSKRPVEICLLDFQMIHYGPLALDLVYFIYTSLSPETFSNLEKLINVYIDELHYWLKLLKEDIGEYTRDNILQDIDDERRLGLAIVCCYLPSMMAEAEDAPKYDTLDEINEEVKTKNNPQFKKRFLELLTHFEKHNILC